MTVYQRLDLSDRVTVERAAQTTIRGFDADTIVRAALAELGAPRTAAGRAAEEDPGRGRARRWELRRGDRLEACERATRPAAHAGPPSCTPLAARVGSDVPFFLADGPQLGRGDGTELELLDLPQDFSVLLFHPPGAAVKRSTAEVYARFDARSGADGFEVRAAALQATPSQAVRRPRDLAAFAAERPRVVTVRRADPRARRLPLRRHRRRSGRVRALHSPAYRVRGPRRESLRGLGRAWITVPAWYG